MHYIGYIEVYSRIFICNPLFRWYMRSTNNSELVRSSITLTLSDCFGITFLAECEGSLSLSYPVPVPVLGLVFSYMVCVSALTLLNPLESVTCRLHLHSHFQHDECNTAAFLW